MQYVFPSSDNCLYTHTVTFEKIDDGDYNMRLSTLFLSNVSSALLPELTEAVKSTLAQFDVEVIKSAVEHIKPGSSKNNRYLS